MKGLPAIALALLAANGAQARLSKWAYPSCALKAQRALKSGTGGSITDAGQAHSGMRANILHADLNTARKARLLGQGETDRLFARVDDVRRATDRFVKMQGFLGAAKRAGYDRELDPVAMRLCSR